MILEKQSKIVNLLIISLQTIKTFMKKGELISQFLKKHLDIFLIKKSLINFLFSTIFCLIKLFINIKEVKLKIFNIESIKKRL